MAQTLKRPARKLCLCPLAINPYRVILRPTQNVDLGPIGIFVEWTLCQNSKSSKRRAKRQLEFKFMNNRRTSQNLLAVVP